MRKKEEDEKEEKGERREKKSRKRKRREKSIERKDVRALNIAAADRLDRTFPGLDVILIESGGDNLTAIFSQGLADRQIFVLDTAGGDDVPRKGGPGVATADLLVINKTDLAPYVGADVERMVSDATARRTGPVVATSVTSEGGVAAIADWVRDGVAAWAD